MYTTPFGRARRGPGGDSGGRDLLRPQCAGAARERAALREVVLVDVRGLRDSIFEGNTQYKQGTIYTWDTLNISLTNCSFADNEATDGRGGAVAFEVSDEPQDMDRSSLQVRDCTFRGNEAKDEGGALYALRIGNVNISNCFFENCKSTNEHGGGAYVQRPQEDDAENLAAASRLDVRDTIFRANEAKKAGGGLYALQVSNVAIIKCEFEGNKAKDEKGGGFYVLPYHQHTNSDVRVLRTSIRNNEAEGNGGGAFVGSAATTTFTDVVVEDNEATDGLGGGACVTHSVNDADSRLDVLDSTFRANTAANLDGGGLYVLQISTVNVDNCVFEDNAAGAKGGGLYTQPHANQASSDVRILNTVLRRNAASSNGGGAYAGSAVTTTFSDVDFLNNSAVGNGGAVNIGEHTAGTANFERVLVKRNTAGGDGAGIHFYRTSGSVRDSTFRENEADDTGGALSQDAQDGNEKDFLIETSTFTSNVAVAGGAVAFKQDMATIRGCTFTSNRAKDEPVQSCVEINQCVGCTRQFFERAVKF